MSEPPAMGRGRRVLVAVLTLIGLPPLLAAVDAVAWCSRNRNNGSIVSSGEQREYLLYVPDSYHPSRPTPLVISMHGGGGWPAMQRDLSGWNRLADSHGFIVAYPSGFRVLGSGPRGWRVVHRGPGLAKDVRFIADLIDTLEAAYNIDSTRIYANGLSNGGGMAFVLSCTLSDRIAAVGTVAAAQMLPFSWCQDPRAVPMIAFHGTADRAAPYEGGTSWACPVPVPDVSEWAATWARRNRCGLEPVESEAAPGVTRRVFTGCAADADVELFTIHGGGHTWPGGEPLPEWFLGTTSHEIDATEVTWEFFQEHRLGTDDHAERGEPGDRLEGSSRRGPRDR